ESSPASEIQRFSSDGTLPRVEIRDSWAMDCSRAWNSAISERWTAPARGILRFLSDGGLQRARFCNSRAMEHSCAWKSAIPGRWNTPTRKNTRFLSEGLFQHVKTSDIFQKRTKKLKNELSSSNF